MSNEHNTKRLLESLRLRKEKKILQDFEKLHHHSDSDDTDSDDDDDDSVFDDVAFYIVGIAFCVLMLIIAFVFLFHSGSDGSSSSNRQRRRHRNQRQAKPTTVDVSLSLNDLYTGKEKTATINRQTVCAGDKSTCQTGVCRGRQVQVHAVRDMWSGAIDRTFYCRYSTKVVGFVPPGTGHGEQIYVEEQGNIQPNMVQGDVVFQIHQLSHRTYKREGRNLQTSIRITLKEALLGWEKTLHHLDARTFVVASKRAHTTQPGEVLVVSNQGMPVRTGRAGQHGDLLVTVNVDFPKTTILEEDIIERIEEVFE